MVDDHYSYRNQMAIMSFPILFAASIIATLLAVIDMSYSIIINMSK